jgi:YidC/Oxa1 family membrane protein insertase
MEINKRTILWIVFAVSLVVLWNDWMVANGKQSMFSPPAGQGRARPARPAEGERPAGRRRRGPAPCRAPPGADAAAAPAPVQTEVITITTDVYKADIDTAGGVIRRLELLKFRDKVDNTRNQLLFHTDATKGRLYLAQTGLTPAAAGVLPNHNTPFVAKPRGRPTANQCSWCSKRSRAACA